MIQSTQDSEMLAGAAQGTTPWENFDALPQALKDVLTKQGILQPTVIQSQSIPAALTGRDVIAQSSTGSGKTLAFTLPVALKLRQHGQLRALILTPTRELATQVAAVLDSTVSSLNLRTLAITGGSSYSRQKRALHEGVDIVVGTPGRINDLITQGVLTLNAIQFFVLDEVDQMLDFGFKDDLEKIRAELTPSVQTLFFSATLSSEIRSIARKLLKNPIEVNVVSSGGQNPSTIQHSYLEVRNHCEQKALINALLFHNPAQAIIFCKTRQECGDLSDALLQRGFDAAALHGDLTQVERNQTLDRFREKRLKYLIATNVAARGIDVQDLPLVVNFNVPFDSESYTHRVGRTGRNGAEGQAWTIVTPQSSRGFETLMRHLKLRPNLIAIPSCAEVIQRSAEGLFNRFVQPRTKTLSKTIEKVIQRQLADLSVEDKDLILKEMFANSLEKLNVYYHDDMVCQKPLVRLNGEDRPERSSRGDRWSRGGRGDREGRENRGGGRFGRGGGQGERSARPARAGQSDRPERRDFGDRGPRSERRSADDKRGPSKPAGRFPAARPSAKAPAPRRQSSPQHAAK